MTEPRPSDLHEVVEKDKRHVWHPMVQHKIFEKKDPLVIVAARGSTVIDARGKEYLDAMAGLWCVNIGYGRTELADVAREQMAALPYYPHTQANVPAAELAQKLQDLLGGGPWHVYFVNSGSEANEAGFKFMRQYAKQAFPGRFRYKIIGRYFAYHGTTLSTLAAGGFAERKQKFEPMDGGFIHVPPPYCYRCPFGLTYPSCGVACARAIEAAIQGEGPDTVAGVVVEPIMSGLGVVVPPPEYLPMVAEICRKYDLVLQIDEVINGFGRTGKMFAHQHYGVEPDILAVAKGIVSAYLPIAATIVKDHVFRAFYGEPEEMKHAVQVNTFGGHPVAAAVAVKNLEIMTAEDLAGRSAEMGEYLLGRLQELLRHPIVGDVRGKGLYAGVELVADKASKKPLPGKLVNWIKDRCLENGVIFATSGGNAVGLGNTIVMSPPLILTRAEADTIVSVLDEAIQAAMAQA